MAIISKPNLYMQPNTWDRLMTINQPEPDVYGDIYVPSVNDLPSLMPSVIDNNYGSQNYGNISKEMKKRKNKYPNVDVTKPNEPGTLGNPYIETRYNPDTGTTSDQFVVQRGDKEWIALTPDEQQSIIDNYKSQGIDPSTVTAIPKKMDIYDPANTQQSAQTSTPVAATGGVISQPNNVTTQPIVQPSTSGTPAATSGTPAWQDRVKQVQDMVTPGGSLTVSVPNDEANQRNMVIYQQQEQAKLDRYNKMKQQLEQANMSADFLNAQSKGLIPGTPQYNPAIMNGDVKPKEGDLLPRDSRGLPSRLIPSSPIPAPPQPGELPKPETMQVHASKRDPRQLVASPDKTKMFYPTMKPGGQIGRWNSNHSVFDGAITQQFNAAVSNPASNFQIATGNLQSVMPNGTSALEEVMPYRVFNPATGKVEIQNTSFRNAQKSWMWKFAESLGLLDKNNNKGFITFQRGSGMPAFDWSVAYEKEGGKLKTDANGNLIPKDAAISGKINQLFMMAAQATTLPTKGYPLELPADVLQQHYSRINPALRNDSSIEDQKQAIWAYPGVYLLSELLNREL